jgi:hypothetical protein
VISENHEEALLKALEALKTRENRKTGDETV